MIEVAFGACAVLALWSIERKHRTRWNTLALDQGWTVQNRSTIQATVCGLPLVIERTHPGGKYHVHLRLPPNLHPSTVDALLQRSHVTSGPPKIEDRAVADLVAILKEIEQSYAQLMVERWGPAIGDLLLVTNHREPMVMLPSHVDTMVRCYQAIEETLLKDLRQLAASERWDLDLGQTWTARNQDGNTMIQISHEPYNAILKCPLPDRVPAGLRIRSRDDSPGPSATGHPILDQYMRIEADNPQNLNSLVENPTFCENVLELVQGMGGEVDLGFVVVVIDEFLLEPSVLWKRMKEVTEALAQP
jgi:hypothetical protein